MYSSTSPNASDSSGGMTKSRASDPTTSPREKPVTRSHASLKNRIRASWSRTQTSDIVVSVRTLANSSQRVNSGICDIEEAHLVVLEREPGRSERLCCELAQSSARLGARPQRRLVGPEGDHERLRVGRIEEPDQAAEPGAVPEPGQELVAHDLEPEIMLFPGCPDGMQAREHGVVLHCRHALRAATRACLGDQPRGPLGCGRDLGRRPDRRLDG